MSSDAKNNEPTMATTQQKRSSATQFSNLMAQKRDTDTAERRANFSEQKIGKPGFIGQIWNDFVRGEASGEVKK
ncbi:hypothetical protein AOQ84DRAFT_381400 [Glonium stellatum]|uniref:Uncharacterized protein n=1 Tax=Glonium stellatum TaxID=574774 RepID=A0A8E2JNW8_9PEZI|nr:hypothetical protein AOQ84DRAFT_381400 [Glonium stellatum]